jgi:hypothetical protein
MKSRINQEMPQSTTKWQEQITCEGNQNHLATVKETGSLRFAMAAHFFGYWAAAFVTLCLGLVLLSVFYRLIDSELGLHGLGKEAAIAGVASFFQGLGA